MADDKKAATKPVEKEAVKAADYRRLYTLTKKYWDNRVLHKAGAQLYFREGEAPPSAVLAEKEEIVAEGDES